MWSVIGGGRKRALVNRPEGRKTSWYDCSMTLTEQLLAKLGTEHTAMADVVRLLIEVEETKYHAEVGYSSVLKYCQGALGLSKSNSLKRINAARLAVRFPTILDRLAK